MSEQAAGSSLLAKLTSILAADALRVAGLQEVGAVAVLPLATGMALTVTLLALKARRPPQAKCVLCYAKVVFEPLVCAARPFSTKCQRGVDPEVATHPSPCELSKSCTAQ